jgi:hypothetical protein
MSGGWCDADQWLSEPNEKIWGSDSNCKKTNRFESFEEAGKTTAVKYTWWVFADPEKTRG